MTKIDWERHKRRPLPPERKSKLEARADRYLEAVAREKKSKRKKGKR